MAVRPRPGVALRIKGCFRFIGIHSEAGEVEDEFDLEIDVPSQFPKELPTVTETGGRIPHEEGFHVNRTDGTLCLGSPLKLRLLLSPNPTLTGFAENCIVPYLFAISQKLKTGVALPFGELAHGAPGALDDYQELFGLDSPQKALVALAVLGEKIRVANKRLCPCGCRRRLGKCYFRARLHPFRKLAKLRWYRAQHGLMLRNLPAGLIPPRKATEKKPRRASALEGSIA